MGTTPLLSIATRLPSVKCNEFHQRDILDRARLPEIVTGCQSDVIIHLAARTDLNQKKDLNGYAANIAGVQNMLEAIESCRSVHRTMWTSSQPSAG